jgi:hypothetical protein
MESKHRDERQANVERPLPIYGAKKPRMLCARFIDRMLLDYSTNELDFYYRNIKTCSCNTAKSKGK